VHRQGASWIEHIRPMLEDHTFQSHFRMDYPSFKFLYGLLRPNLNHDVEMANLPNGVVAGEWVLTSTLRWLSGGSYFEMMDGPTTAKSTAYSMLNRTLEANNSCPDLAIVWLDDDRLEHIAAGFRACRRPGIMDRCTGVVDGLFIRIHKPRAREHPAPARFYSGYKKGSVLNLQVTSKRLVEHTTRKYLHYPFTNDRTAWNMSNVNSKAELPDGYYIIGDSASPPSDHLLAIPGNLSLPHEDAFNFYSQARIDVEQAFGILVMTWGILLKPLRVSLHNTGKICPCLHESAQLQP
ncbi:unnamed protein product, partial [Discosporangium mesarthrocarpum]